MVGDLSDYIVVFENIVPHELCDEVMKEYESDSNWVQATIRDGINTDIRNCHAINMSDPFIISQNDEKRRKIDHDLFVCAANAIQKYNNKFPLAHIQSDSGYTLLRYRENGFYKTHTDSFYDAPRAVSCSFAMNDDYEGGEFAFFGQKVKHKIKKGDALMFPSNFMYPHEVMEVTSGTRFSIITWFA